MFELNTTILIVDDATTMRKLLIKYLKELGFSNFLEAKDGVEGLAIVQDSKDFPVGIIICDWNMPEKTGIQLLQDVRGDENYKNMPFIMISSEQKEENILLAAQSGVNAYLVKPVNTEMLKQKLEMVHQKINKKK